jgi:hypothetical protein
MDKNQLLVQVARERLKLKKFMDLLFGLLILVPISFVAIFRRDDLLTGNNILSWFASFAFLAFLQWRIWRCPACEKSLTDFRRKNYTRAPRACRHCGFLLQPDQPLKKFKSTKLKIRNGFIAIILLIAMAFVAVGFFFDFSEMIGVGVAMAFLCAMAWFASRRVKFCQACGAPKVHKHCENCGAY